MSEQLYRSTRIPLPPQIDKRERQWFEAVTNEINSLKQVELDIRDFGDVGKGHNDHKAIQRAIFEAEDLRATLRLASDMTFYIDSPLQIANPMTLTGTGAVSGKWADDIASSRIVWTGGTSNAAIIVGATAWSRLTESGYPFIEAVTLKNFGLFTDGSTSTDGIIIDGGNTLYASRGFARNILLEDVDVNGFDGVCLRLLGNVFHTRFLRCGFRNGGLGSFTGETTTVNVGVTRPGQIYLYDCFGFSSAGQWAFNTQFTTFYGGHAQGGGHGIKLGNDCNIFGTHIEGQGSDSTGLAITRRHCTIFPKLISNYSTGIQIGDSANASDHYFGFVPLLNKCYRGISVLAGGTREGILHLGRIDSSTVTTEIFDERKLNDFRTHILASDVSNHYQVEDYRFSGDTIEANKAFYMPAGAQFRYNSLADANWRLGKVSGVPHHVYLTGSGSAADKRQFAVLDMPSGTTRMAVQFDNGVVSVNSSPSVSSAQFQVSGQTMALSGSFTPASGTASGATGDMCWDDDYVYVCTSEDSWARAGLARF